MTRKSLQNCPSAILLTAFCSLRTPVFALYQVPTIVSATILLATRFLDYPLPDQWWVLFDADWDDVWSVCGYIMRLYRERTDEEKNRIAGMISKKEVRRWLDDHGRPTSAS
jgi:cyclin L